MIMFPRLFTTSAAPVDDRHTARLLGAGLWGLLVWAVASGIATTLTEAGDPVAAAGSALIFGSLAVAALGTLWLAHSGRVRAAVQLLVALLYVGFTVVGATRDASLFLLYALLVLISGVVLGKVPALLIAALCAITGLCIVGVGTGSARPSPGALPRWAGDTLALGWTAWLVYLVSGRPNGVLAGVHRPDEAGEPQHPEGDDLVRLAQLSRRNLYLQAVVTIAEDTAGLVDEDELLSRSADLALRELPLNQVRIYLVDPSGERLGLRAWASSKDVASSPPQRSFSVDQGSLVGRVVQTGHPALRPDPGAEVGLGEQNVPLETRAEMALPLRIEGELVGVLDLHSPVATSLSRDDAATLQMLANQIAVAIRRARTFSLLQQRAASARAERREFAAEEWRRALRARSELAVVRNERGLYHAPSVWRTEMSGAMESGDVTFGDHDRAVLAAPIWVRDQVIGVIDVRKPAGAPPWSYQEVALMKTLCGQLGQALENARLYESVQQGEEQARLLGQAAARMRESLDVETVLEVAAEEIRRALGLAALEVRLQRDGEDDG